MEVSSSSSSEDEEFFYQTPVQPYMFEPYYTEEEVRVRRQTQEETPQAASQGADRTKDTFWCTCNKCICLKSDDECICCHEMPAAQALVDIFDPGPGVEMETQRESTADMAGYQQKCLTLHPDFNAHLNEAVLDTYFRSHTYNWKKFPKPSGPGGTLSNAQLRLVGYRFVLDWLLQGERLGKKKRIPLPACVVNAIRLKFPADDNEYVGFRYADLPTV